MAIGEAPAGVQGALCTPSVERQCVCEKVQARSRGGRTMCVTVRSSWSLVSLGRDIAAPRARGRFPHYSTLARRPCHYSCAGFGQSSALGWSSEPLAWTVSVPYHGAWPKPQQARQHQEPGVESIELHEQRMSLSVRG